MYIYECDSVVCKGESYIVTQKPLVCPYCDTSALYEEPKYKAVILEKAMKEFIEKVESE